MGMKILYSVQATGNGHISRAKQILPYLKAYGDVDVFLSGSNSTLDVGIEYSYKSKGLSLFYKKCGGLDYKRMFVENSVRRALKDAKELPVEKYDIVINDFDFITSKACQFKNVKSVQFGHQASFMSKHTPRPESKSRIGELILKKYATASQYLGLHFEPYDKFVFSPVIKKAILNSNPKDMGHVTVYLPSYQKMCVEKIFLSLDDIQFQWFLPHITEPFQKKNIKYFPIDNDLFSKSLIFCHGIITGGGFETPAEAMYLKKKTMVIPIRNHYEQKCNAVAAEKLGATHLDDIDCKVFADQIRSWLKNGFTDYNQSSNNVKETVEYLLDTY